MVEQKAVSKASSKTKLSFGLVHADVALYKLTGEAAKVTKFDAGGPSGGVLRVEEVAQAAPVEETPVAKPLAVEQDRPSAPTVPGEYARKLIEEGTGEVVEPDAIRRGVRTEEGKFIDLTAQIDDIEQRTQLDAMEVVATIDVSQVQRERVLAAYYVAGDAEGAPKVLRVLFEAMRQARRVAVVKWTKSSRQACGIIAPHGKSGALVLLQLAWAEDVRKPNAKCLAHQQAQVTESEVVAAKELLMAMADTREALDVLRDDAISLREELREAALAGKVETFEMAPPVETPDEPDIVELMARSAEAAKAAAA